MEVRARIEGAKNARRPAAALKLEQQKTYQSESALQVKPLPSRQG